MFFSLGPPKDHSKDVISSGYNRTPFTPPGTILKVKQWKSKTQYDLMLNEQFAKEAEARRATDFLIANDKRIKQEKEYWSNLLKGPKGKGSLK